MFDEINFLQLGRQDEYSFYDMEFTSTSVSSLNQWPNNYKFTSLAIGMAPESNVIERSTYSVLEWLGDVGGLHDALTIIGYYIVCPFAAFNLDFELLRRLFNQNA